VEFFRADLAIKHCPNLGSGILVRSAATSNPLKGAEDKGVTGKFSVAWCDPNLPSRDDSGMELNVK